jgi:hypothetical protein
MGSSEAEVEFRIDGSQGTSPKRDQISGRSLIWRWTVAPNFGLPEIRGSRPLAAGSHPFGSTRWPGVQTRVPGSRIPPDADPVFDQPALERRIGRLKSLANSLESIFFGTLEARVNAIRIDDPRNKSLASAITAVSN